MLYSNTTHQITQLNMKMATTIISINTTGIALPIKTMGSSFVFVEPDESNDCFILISLRLLQTSAVRMYGFMQIHSHVPGVVNCAIRVDAFASSPHGAHMHNFWEEFECRYSPAAQLSLVRSHSNSSVTTPGVVVVCTHFPPTLSLLNP
jgi:hypothetical protein